MKQKLTRRSSYQRSEQDESGQSQIIIPTPNIEDIVRNFASSALGQNMSSNNNGPSTSNPASGSLIRATSSSKINSPMVNFQNKVNPPSTSISPLAQNQLQLSTKSVPRFLRTPLDGSVNRTTLSFTTSRQNVHPYFSFGTPNSSNFSARKIGENSFKAPKAIISKSSSIPRPSPSPRTPQLKLNSNQNSTDLSVPAADCKLNNANVEMEDVDVEVIEEESAPLCKNCASEIPNILSSLDRLDRMATNLISLVKSELNSNVRTVPFSVVNDTPVESAKEQVRLTELEKAIMEKTPNQFDLKQLYEYKELSSEANNKVRSALEKHSALEKLISLKLLKKSFDDKNTVVYMKDLKRYRQLNIVIE